MPINFISQKISKNIFNYLRGAFPNCINDTGIENVTGSNNTISFTATFSLYNFFTVEVTYCDNTFEWYIRDNDDLISLNCHKKYNAETDIDIFVKDLRSVAKQKIYP